MRTLAIINPRSGQTEDLSRVASLIRGHPALEGVDIRITGEREDAALFAAAGVQHGFRRIFAVGGDGTLNEVVNGLMSAEPHQRSELLLGLLPLGTGNDFARSIGIPLDLEEALDAIEGLHQRRVDVVRVSGNGERPLHFINCSAGGFSGEVDERVTSERKRDWGPLAYLRGALDVLPDPGTYKVEIVVDGDEPECMEALNVAIANGRSVASGIPVAPTAKVDDGLLEVVVVRAAGMGKLAAFGSRCLVGKHLEHELCRHLRGRTIVVRSEPSMGFNIDGELGAETPLEYRVLPGALTTLVAPGAPGLRDG